MSVITTNLLPEGGNTSKSSNAVYTKHIICQTVGNVQHHTMTVQCMWKTVSRAGRSADHQLLVSNDKR